jgi:hypothetical protein
VLWDHEPTVHTCYVKGGRLMKARLLASFSARSWMLSMDREVALIAGRSKVRKSKPMPHRRLIASLANSPQRRRFRERYNELEVRRAKLLARLHLFGEAAQHHPAYKHAETLLNVTFRKEKKVAQRAAVLKSAAWLISLLEQLPGIL